MTKKSQQIIADLLKHADIKINGQRPWDIKIHSSCVFDKVLAHGNLGLGESYVEGKWDCPKLDHFFHLALSSQLDQKLSPMKLLPHHLKSKFVNLQTSKRAWQVAEKHYNLGNNFYEKMLDSRMTYTCGYWKKAQNLEEAQIDKLELICQKLQLEPGMKVLDIGCGWGSFMSYANEHYGVECEGVTISEEQAKWATKRYQGHNLKFKIQDYRKITGQFDRIVSIGMFEHVGRRNHRIFMEVVNRSLKQDGLFLLHTIGKNMTRSTPDPWIDRYIFPNGDLPSIKQIGKAVEGLFITEDLHNFGHDYDKTLMAWYENFEESWVELRTEFDEQFFRMWRYYLLSCAGAFRARDIQLWQWIFSKQGVTGGYQRVA